MEKIFGIVKWWTGLKPTDKLLAFMVTAIIGLSTVAVRLYSTNAILQKENLSARVEAEQRVASSVAFVRNRYDSMIAEKERSFEIERQTFYNRTPIIKERNNKIINALK